MGKTFSDSHSARVFEGSPKAGMIGMTGAAGVTAGVLAMCGQPGAIAYRHASLACDMVGTFLQCSNPPLGAALSCMGMVRGAAEAAFHRSRESVQRVQRR